MTEPHLSDETLSACIDGAPPDGGHLAGCARCRDRLAALARARDLVRTPVSPVDASKRAASVAAAVAGAWQPGTGTDGSASAPHPASERPPDPAAAHLLPWRRPRPAVVAGAAAAVAALAAAVALPLALSHPGSESASRAPGSRHSSGSAASSVAGAGALRPEVTTPGGNGSAASSAQATVPSPGSSSAPGGIASPVAEAAALGLVDAGPVASVTSLAAQAATIESGAGAAASSATVGAFSRCLPVASSAARPASSLLRLATATVDGTPALVYVFVTRAGTTATGSPVAVALTSGCSVLGSVSL